MSGMSIQPVSYQGRIRAFCTARRVYLVDAPVHGNHTPFVLAMCLYAGAILNGQLPGPYRERDARAFARAILIPAELTESPRTSTTRATPIAAWLGVPASELRIALGPRRTTRPKGRRRGYCPLRPTPA